MRYSPHAASPLSRHRPKPQSRYQASTCDRITRNPSSSRSGVSGQLLPPQDWITWIFGSKYSMMYGLLVSGELHKITAFGILSWFALISRCSIFVSNSAQSTWWSVIFCACMAKVMLPYCAQHSRFTSSPPRCTTSRTSVRSNNSRYRPSSIRYECSFMGFSWPQFGSPQYDDHGCWSTHNASSPKPCSAPDITRRKKVSCETVYIY